MRYLIRESGDIYDDYEEAVDACIDEDWHRDDDYFENWLNDCYDSVTICGTTYYPYDILRAMDDENYYDALNDFCRDQNDNDRDNAEFELRHANIGDTVDVHNNTIEVIPDEYETGDFDGDDVLEKTRTFIDEQNSLSEMKRQEEKQTEDDLMKLLIGV